MTWIHYAWLTCVSVVGKIFLNYDNVKVLYSSKNTKTVMQTYMYLHLSRLHMAIDKFCHSLAYIINVKNVTKR